MRGPQLPQRQSTSRHTRQALENVAFQIGLVLAVERKRRGITQHQLADEIGTASHLHISRIENGKPALRLTDDHIDKLFDALGLDAKRFGLQREFVKWWQDAAR